MNIYTLLRKKGISKQEAWRLIATPIAGYEEIWTTLNMQGRLVALYENVPQGRRSGGRKRQQPVKSEPTQESTEGQKHEGTEDKS